MAATLPPVNLGFDEIKYRMDQFTAKFDVFIVESRKKLREEKEAFSQKMSADKNSHDDMKKQIEDEKKEENKITEQTRRQREEIAEAQHHNSELFRQKQSKQEHQSQLQAQVKEVVLAIQKKREIKAKERSVLASQSLHNEPELACYEDYFGLRIDGAAVADKLKITYTQIVDTDWEKEHYFILNMEKREYLVEQCRPRIPEEQLEQIVNKLNETRNFTFFLKEMRLAFSGKWTGQ